MRNDPLSCRATNRNQTASLNHIPVWSSPASGLLHPSDARIARLPRRQEDDAKALPAHGRKALNLCEHSRVYHKPNVSETEMKATDQAFPRLRRENFRRAT